MKISIFYTVIFNNKIYSTTFKENDVAFNKNDDAEKKIEPKKSPLELALIVQTAIKKKSKIKSLDR